MRKLVMFAAVIATLAAFAVPAGAAGQWTGVISTACTTRLDDFPNNPPSFINSDNCDADTGTAPTGGVAIDWGIGAIRTQTTTWTGGGLGATRVRFSYNENCAGQQQGVFPLIGSAAGDFLVSGTGGRLMAGFSWNRTGLVATISFGTTNGGTTDAPSGSQIVASGQFGLDTNNNFADGAEQDAPAGTTAQAVGLLMPQGPLPGASSGGNVCSPTDIPNQHEVVTAYALGGLSG